MTLISGYLLSLNVSTEVLRRNINIAVNLCQQTKKLSCRFGSVVFAICLVFPEPIAVSIEDAMPLDVQGEMPAEQKK